jgi:hypothetical protein
MRLGRWVSVILPMGLVLALSPLSAQAGPRQPFAPQQHRQAFTRPQPRAFASGWNHQPHQWQQPRGHVFGWQGQPHQWQQPRGKAYGWNGQNRQWNHYRNTSGWNDHWRRWDQHRNAYGWNGQPHQWQQPANNASGWNSHQRQWQQPRPATVQGEPSVNQPANAGQQSYPGSSYNHAGYPAQAQSPNTSSCWSGSHHNSAVPASQTGSQPVSNPEPSGDNPQPTGLSPAGAI